MTDKESPPHIKKILRNKDESLYPERIIRESQEHALVSQQPSEIKPSQNELDYLDALLEGKELSGKILPQRLLEVIEWEEHRVDDEINNYLDRKEKKVLTTRQKNRMHVLEERSENLSQLRNSIRKNIPKPFNLGMYWP